MNDTRREFQVIKSSKVIYTIIRVAYMIDYETTQKGETYKGAIVSRKSIANYIMRLIQNPKLDNYSSVGISKSVIDGDRPMF